MSAQAHMFRPTRIRELAAAFLVVAETVLVFLGWFESTALLGIALAGQLALGGSLGIALLGPARGDRGVARYLTLPLTAIGVTLFGRSLPPDQFSNAIALAVVAAGVLWGALQIEMAYARGDRPKILLDILLAAVMFLGAASFGPLIGDDPPMVSLGLVGLLGFALGLRAAEARGTSGGTAVGHALLQGFTVIQVGVALYLLELPGVVGPAVMFLAFYGWSGAADDLHAGVSKRRVFVEYGALALFGLVVVLIVLGLPAAAGPGSR